MNQGKKITQDKFDELIRLELAEIGKTIDEKMVRKGVYNKDISMVTGLSPNRIGSLRRGELSPHSTMLTLLKITTYLGIEIKLV